LRIAWAKELSMAATQKILVGKAALSIRQSVNHHLAIDRRFAIENYHKPTHTRYLHYLVPVSRKQKTCSLANYTTAMPVSKAERLILVNQIHPGLAGENAKELKRFKQILQAVSKKTFH
jgi:uncharacterized protein YfbU (UPF0304 family)